MILPSRNFRAVISGLTTYPCQEIRVPKGPQEKVFSALQARVTGAQPPAAATISTLEQHRDPMNWQAHRSPNVL